MDIQSVKAMYDINVFGPIRMLHASAELLIATANANAKQATVLNISSTARHMPPWQGAHGSSKVSNLLMYAGFDIRTLKVMRCFPSAYRPR